MVAGLVVMSLIKLPQTPVQIDGGDKLLHLGSYFFLSYWFHHAYHRYPWQVSMGFLCLGLTLEWMQSLTTYRHVEWMDGLMNLSGVMLAWLLYQVVGIRIKSCIID